MHRGVFGAHIHKAAYMVDNACLVTACFGRLYKASGGVKFWVSRQYGYFHKRSSNVKQCVGVWALDLLVSE
jgi:hypothetical protein